MANIDYEFRYSLTSRPEPRSDGTGLVMHQTRVVAREEGTSNDFTYRAGLPSKTIEVPSADLLTVMAMPDNGAKVTAYKNLLATNLNTQAVPVTGWDLITLEAVMDANDQSADAATQANEYITVTLGQDYPVRFSM